MTRFLAALVALLTLTLSSPVRARETTLPERLDAIATEAFAGDEPGGTVVVVRNGASLLRKGYGLADLELAVRARPEMVYRIGSMTKQFTAVAILRLVQEGRLKLGDSLSKYVPGLPTGITVEQLLTHTSGLTSYNDARSYAGTVREDRTPMELLEDIRQEKAAFPPGQGWKYSNSGYLLLGIVIEKASGTTYADYLRTKLFGPLGLGHTSVVNETRITPGRVRGYEVGPDGLLGNAGYISMTQPYAAGAVESNVDDLARWSELLMSGKVVEKALLDRAWSESRIQDGSPTGNGYGWKVRDEGGVRFVEHGGTITGFESYGVLVPEKGIFVGVLHNAQGPRIDPEYTAKRLALEVLGQGWSATPVAMSDKAKARFSGIYDFEGVKRTVRFEQGTLSIQQEGGPPFALIPVASDEFVYDKAFTRLKFRITPSGTVESVLFQARGRPAHIGRRVADAPVARKAISLSQEQLDRLTGVYEAEGGFQFTITREGARLLMHATGQGLAEAFPESETRFFFKVVDAEVEFTFGEDRRASGLTLHQGGHTIPAKRVE